jgi:hypothetical protein
MMSWSRSFVLGLVAVTAYACGGDDDDVGSEPGDPPQGMLDEGGLSPALLTRDDLGDGWSEPAVDPPHGSAIHFVCMPLYFEGSFDTGVSIEFSATSGDLQQPDISQRIARYPESGEAAMDAASRALDFCYGASSLSSLGELFRYSLDGVGDENLIAQLTGELEGAFSLEETEVDAVVESATSGESRIQELSWRGAYIRRGDLITLLMAIEVEESEFERLLRIADERLQELD